MDYILTNKANWGGFLAIAIALLFFYFALQFLRRLLRGASSLRIFQQPIRKGVDRLLLMYEMLVILILGSVFVLINPFYHGLLLLIMLVIGFSHIKNYFSGRLIKLGGRIKKGCNIRTGHLEGVVSKMERLGINLLTQDGLHHLQYNQLLLNGYTLLAGEDIGGFYQLVLTPKKEEEKKINHSEKVLDLLITAPYLDWHHKPEVETAGDTDELIKAKVLLREESHLKELMALIKEWGYGVKLT